MQYYHETGQLARAYIPFQKLGELFTPDCALLHGTAFQNLYQPYEYEYAGHGYRGVKNSGAISHATATMPHSGI